MSSHLLPLTTRHVVTCPPEKLLREKSFKALISSRLPIYETQGKLRPAIHSVETHQPRCTYSTRALDNRLSSLSFFPKRPQEHRIHLVAGAESPFTTSPPCAITQHKQTLLRALTHSTPPPSLPLHTITAKARKSLNHPAFITFLNAQHAPKNTNTVAGAYIILHHHL